MAVFAPCPPLAGIYWCRWLRSWLRSPSSCSSWTPSSATSGQSLQARRSSRPLTALGTSQGDEHCSRDGEGGGAYRYSKSFPFLLMKAPPLMYTHAGLAEPIEPAVQALCPSRVGRLPASVLLCTDCYPAPRGCTRHAVRCSAHHLGAAHAMQCVAVPSTKGLHTPCSALQGLSCSNLL